MGIYWCLLVPVGDLCRDLSGFHGDLLGLNKDFAWAILGNACSVLGPHGHLYGLNAGLW